MSITIDDPNRSTLHTFMSNVERITPYVGNIFIIQLSDKPLMKVRKNYDNHYTVLEVLND